MADPVVVGYDGSTPSRRALDFAADLARPLVVAYVCAPGGGGLDMGLAPQICDSADQHSDVLRWLGEEVGEALGADATVEPVELVGDAARELGELAERRGAYAVVVGRPEHRVHQIGGSVPVRLARHAPCPLIVVP